MNSPKSALPELMERASQPSDVVTKTDLDQASSVDVTSMSNPFPSPPSSSESNAPQKDVEPTTSTVPQPVITPSQLPPTPPEDVQPSSKPIDIPRQSVVGKHRKQWELMNKELKRPPIQNLIQFFQESPVNTSLLQPKQFQKKPVQRQVKLMIHSGPVDFKRQSFRPAFSNQSRKTPQTPVHQLVKMFDQRIKELDLSTGTFQETGGTTATVPKNADSRTRQFLETSSGPSVHVAKQLFPTGGHEVDASRDIGTPDSHSSENKMLQKAPAFEPSPSRESRHPSFLPELDRVVSNYAALAEIHQQMQSEQPTTPPSNGSVSPSNGSVPTSSEAHDQMAREASDPLLYFGNYAQSVKGFPYSPKPTDAVPRSSLNEMPDQQTDFEESNWVRSSSTAALGPVQFSKRPGDVLKDGKVTEVLSFDPESPHEMHAKELPIEVKVSITNGENSELHPSKSIESTQSDIISSEMPLFGKPNPNHSIRSEWEIIEWPMDLDFFDPECKSLASETDTFVSANSDILETQPLEESREEQCKEARKRVSEPDVNYGGRWPITAEEDEVIQFLDSILDEEEDSFHSSFDLSAPFSQCQLAESSGPSSSEQVPNPPPPPSPQLPNKFASTQELGDFGQEVAKESQTLPSVRKSFSEEARQLLYKALAHKTNKPARSDSFPLYSLPRPWSKRGDDFNAKPERHPLYEEIDFDKENWGVKEPDIRARCNSDSVFCGRALRNVSSQSSLEQMNWQRMPSPQRSMFGKMLSQEFASHQTFNSGSKQVTFNV